MCVADHASMFKRSTIPVILNTSFKNPRKVGWISAVSSSVRNYRFRGVIAGLRAGSEAVEPAGASAWCRIIATTVVMRGVPRRDVVRWRGRRRAVGSEAVGVADARDEVAAIRRSTVRHATVGRSHGGGPVGAGLAGRQGSPSAFVPVRTSCSSGVGAPVHWPLIITPCSSMKMVGSPFRMCNVVKFLRDQLPANVVPGAGADPVLGVDRSGAAVSGGVLGAQIGMPDSCCRPAPRPAANRWQRMSAPTRPPQICRSCSCRW